MLTAGASEQTLAALAQSTFNKWPNKHSISTRIVRDFGRHWLHVWPYFLFLTNISLLRFFVPHGLQTIGDIVFCLVCWNGPPQILTFQKWHKTNGVNFRTPLSGARGIWARCLPFKYRRGMRVGITFPSDFACSLPSWSCNSARQSRHKNLKFG